MTFLCRALRQRRDADAGVTLAELLVTMMITTIVMALSASILVATIRQRRVSDARASSQSDARVMVELLTRDLRTAVPSPASSSLSAFSFASPTKITFFTKSGGATAVVTMISYEVDATSKCLRRTVTDYNGTSFPTSSAKSRCTAPSLVNTDGQSLFSFYRIRSNATSDPTAVVPPSAGYTTPANDDPLKYVAGVRLTLWLRDKTNPSVSPTVVDQSITLVNQSNLIRMGGIT